MHLDVLPDERLHARRSLRGDLARLSIGSSSTGGSRWQEKDEDPETLGDSGVGWSGTPGSNRRPSPWQGDALPAELVPRNGSGLAPQIPCVKSVEGADVVHRGGDSGDEREVEQHQSDRLEVRHRPDEEVVDGEVV